MKRNATIRDAIDLDDVLLQPAETQVKPADVAVKTRLTRAISLNLPLLSAGADYVTEAPMAIAIARAGGLGIIHDNMPLGNQVEEVRRVKRAQSDMVVRPITISPESSLTEALDLMTTYGVSGLPVIEQPSEKVVGIVTNRDVRFCEDYSLPVTAVMTKDVVSVTEKVAPEIAKRLMHEKRIEKLVVLDDKGRCAGLITVKDIEKRSLFPQATLDDHGRLRVGAAVSAGKNAVDRALAMADAGLDVVFVDVAHAHSRDAVTTVNLIRQQRSSDIQVVAGNVATPDAARSLIDAGADAVKIGIGPRAGSATRSMVGVGLPQLTAILDVVEQCQMMDIPAIVEGGVNCAASLAKAIAAGAESVVIADLFAGTDEAPGEVFYHDGRAYKVVNPEARAQHRPQASAIVQDPYKLDEDAVDTSIPYRGAVNHVVRQLVTGLKTAMAYTGGRDIAAFRDNAEFVRVK